MGDGRSVVVVVDTWIAACISETFGETIPKIRGIIPWTGCAKRARESLRILTSPA